MGPIFYGTKRLIIIKKYLHTVNCRATIVRDKRIIAGGYNGSVSGGTHCIDEGCYVVDNHCVRTIHAEMNAILQCAKFGVPTEGAEIYVTHFPCLQCTKMILQAGIKKIYYLKDYRNDAYALNLIEQVGATVEKVTLVPKYFAELQWEKNLPHLRTIFPQLRNNWFFIALLTSCGLWCFRT